jgi:putative transposase
LKETDDEAQPVQRRTDHRDIEGAPGGLSAQDLCRKHGISDATFYKWRSKYGGMDISDARRLKALEEENRKLKKLLAESMLDAATLKEMLGKNF